MLRQLCGGISCHDRQTKRMKRQSVSSTASFGFQASRSLRRGLAAGGECQCFSLMMNWTRRFLALFSSEELGTSALS